MPSLGMKGPYVLTIEEIDKRVTKKSPGNYALGDSDNGKFIVRYVGRSDTDINRRLKDHAGEYKQFKFCYAKSPKAAFEKECVNYHDFGEKQKLDNNNHPDRPENTNWKCPVCDIFD